MKNNNRFFRLINPRPFWSFYVLTFLLLVFIPLLSLIFNDGSMNFDEAAQRATEVTGIEWTSNLVVALRLSLVEPILLLNILGSVVPALAAIIVLLFLKKHNKWFNFFGRLNPIRNTSFISALRIYGIIFLLLIPCLFGVFYLRKATGGVYELPELNFGFGLISAIFSIALLDQGAVLEELGWRGFATPELQDSGNSPIKVALIIGLCWGLWHLPRDFTSGVFDRLGFIQYAFLYLPAFITGTVAVSILASYFMNRLGGSVIPAIIVHGITNDALGFSGAASIIEALTPYHQATKNIPLALIAVAIYIYAGSSLGKKRDSEAKL